MSLLCVVLWHARLGHSVKDSETIFGMPLSSKC